MIILATIAITLVAFLSFYLLELHRTTGKEFLLCLLIPVIPLGCLILVGTDYELLEMVPPIVGYIIFCLSAVVRWKMSKRQVSTKDTLS